MRRFLSMSLIVAFVGLSALLARAELVHGQDDTEPSKNPAVYKDQLLKFTLLTKKNLRDIQALPNDDSVPVDPQLRHNAHRAYQLIRAAQWGMGVAIQVQSYPDPILRLAQKRAEEAWQLARYPVDFTGVSRAEYISTSVQNLTRSLRLAQQALVMLP
jgi:hypothetical protein